MRCAESVGCNRIYSRSGLVYYMMVCYYICHCCLRHLMEITSLASFHETTFGWLMCFPFCVCQVTVCFIFIAQRTLLIETIEAPICFAIDVLPLMFVLLRRLHIVGVVYHSARICQFTETQASESVPVPRFGFCEVSEAIWHKYIYCILSFWLVGRYSICHIPKRLHLVSSTLSF